MNTVKSTEQERTCVIPQCCSDN